MDNKIVSMCLQFLIILPSSLGLEPEALSSSVVSGPCLTVSAADSSNIKRKLWREI